MGGKPSRPRFLWQGLPILLPVAIMAVIALVAIAWDRAAVEEEARRRGEEIARQLQSVLEQQWASELNRFRTISFLKLQTPREQGLGSGSNATAAKLSADLAAWRLDYPTLTTVDSAPYYVDFTADGNIRFPPGEDFPPRPPASWLSLSPAQRDAWQKLEFAQATGASTADVERLREAFVATKPPAEVLMADQVVILRNHLREMPPAEAAQAAVAFIQTNHLIVRSEAGIPLASLLMGDAIKRSRDFGPPSPIWDGINFVVHLTPSFMTPRLLDEMEEIAGVHTPQGRNIGALRYEWESQNKARRLALNIRDNHHLQSFTTTNFWIDQDGGHWFCTTEPTWINPEPAISNQVIAVYLYPRELVSLTLQHTLRSSLGGIPDYLGATVELAGESFTIGSNSNNISAGNAPLLLAQTTGRLTQAVHPPAGTMPDGTAIAPAADFEGMAGNPFFTVRVLLLSRKELLAQHRTRAYLLDGLILGSAFAALVGFFAARRAFLNQVAVSEMKSNFVSSVSHELRAPIASVRLMAESLERGKVNEPQKQNEYFRFIGQECRRLSSLIENVLDFSRIEQGRKQYEFEPTDLAALTRETVKLMEPYAEEKGVQLKIETPNSELRTPSELEVDGRAIQQALVNLIDNAIKHSAKGQTVSIGLDSAQSASGVPPDKSAADTTTLGSSSILLYVEDHGPGIPPAEHEKIFERFYRLGSELRRETQGVGIGLSIVRHIVAAHGGKVTVRSNLGEGSRFTIVLPRERLK